MQLFSVKEIYKFPTPIKFMVTAIILFDWNVGSLVRARIAVEKNTFSVSECCDSMTAVWQWQWQSDKLPLWQVSWRFDWQVISLVLCGRQDQTLIISQRCSFSLHTDHTQTHHQQLLLLRPFNGLFSSTTWVSRHQKGKPLSILLEQDMMGWQWHQLDHMQIIYTSLQTDNHASTSPLSFHRPDALPAAQPTASKHWRQHLPYNP